MPNGQRVPPFARCSNRIESTRRTLGAARRPCAMPRELCTFISELMLWRVIECCAGVAIACVATASKRHLGSVVLRPHRLGTVLESRLSTGSHGTLPRSRTLSQGSVPESAGRFAGEAAGTRELPPKESRCSTEVAPASGCLGYSGLVNIRPQNHAPFSLRSTAMNVGTAHNR